MTTQPPPTRRPGPAPSSRYSHRFGRISLGLLAMRPGSSRADLILSQPDQCNAHMMARYYGLTIKTRKLASGGWEVKRIS